MQRKDSIHACLASNNLKIHVSHSSTWEDCRRCLNQAELWARDLAQQQLVLCRDIAVNTIPVRLTHLPAS